MSHKIYGQQVLFIEEDNPIVASTPEEMVALLTSDNVGKFVKYIGETRDFEFSTPTGRNIPVNPVTVDNSVEKWYFDNSVTPDFTQFAWSDLSSSETESIRLCTVAVPGTTSGDKYILSVTRFPKGSRFASGWPQLKEDAYTIRIPYTSPSFTGYVYVSTEELANQIRHTGANPPQVHQGWMVKQGTWNKDDYGWWVTNVSQQDVWGGYISKDGKWTAEVINTNLSLVKDAFYKISEEIDIARYIEVPILTNEGTAADLASGKQLINSSGEVVTGTATIAPTPGPEPETGYFVKVIDYDGTELLSAQGENGDSFTLPSAPSHDGLVFQGWSASCPITNGAVTIDNNNIMIGATYTTVSGLNEFDIELTEDFGLSVFLKIDGEKDWGDGTTDSETTHTYATYGNYTIRCGGTTLGSYFYSMPCPFARLATVTSVDIHAFDCCSGLASVTISNSVTSIGSYAFSYCSNLTSITIPNSVTSIYDGTFLGCSNLTSVTIPNGVTDISYEAFSVCSSLTNVAIPNSVTSISDSAFNSCSGLTSIIIPNSVTNISSNAFRGCSSLKSVTIPNSETVISSYAFGYCSNLKSVTISNGVTRISGSAFYKCSSLTSITIPDSVTSIGNSAFQECSSLTSITIPDSVTSIGSYAFYNCSGLTSITIPDGVTGIGSYTFFGCSSLKSITIPNSVTNIDIYAFWGCSSLTSIIIPNSVTNISSNAFRGCSSLTSIVIPDGVTSIGESAFNSCSSLTSITIPDSVTSIDNYAFSYCRSLTSITIPNGVTNISNQNFRGCSSLTSIVIPDGVTSISGGAFRDCGSLTSIVIPDSVTSIGESAFNKCSRLTSVTIPNGVTSIGSETFFGCSNLTSITIPNGVTSIGDYTFSECSSLTSVIIPNSVTDIGGSAFSYCSGLTSITLLPTTPPTLGWSVFTDISSSAIITVPKGTLDAYKAATNWSDYADKMVEAAN